MSFPTGKDFESKSASHSYFVAGFMEFDPKSAAHQAHHRYLKKGQLSKTPWFNF
jgi:hypothetical protein